MTDVEQTDGGKTPGAAATPAASRRFYSTVSIRASGGEEFSVLLDDRPVKTPKKAVLAVPGARLAHVIAAEWEAQADRVLPATMPLTRLVNSAIDIVAPNAAAVREEIVGYAMTDALCYRADAPSDLVARQQALWNPPLIWARRALDAEFVVTTGIAHVRQSEATRQALIAAVGEIEVLPLAAVHVATTLTGSAILALAVRAGAISAEEAWTAAHADEDHQIALWGEDAEARERRQRRWQDMAAAATLLETFR